MDPPRAHHDVPLLETSNLAFHAKAQSRLECSDQANLLKLNLAIRLNKARTNPVAGVKLLAEHNLHMRVVSREEESACLAAASQPLRDVATIILETGMRPGEVFHLRREDVNLEIGFLQIPRGKTLFARRTIPITKRALTVLSHRVFEATTEWVFPSRNDPNRPIGWLRKAHIETLKQSAINPPFRLYDLRHTALTRMAMAGIDLPTLRELAGHANIRMTMRYVHPTPEHKRAAIQKLEAFVSPGWVLTPTWEAIDSERKIIGDMP